MKKPSKVSIDLTVRIGSSLQDATPAALKVNSVKLKAQARCLLGDLELGGSELSICLTDDAGIRELNLQYRDKDKATDVLSFPMDDDDYGDVPSGSVSRVLGDVIISAETARRQAEDYGAGFYAEMARLLVHGTLHLLGFDHVNGGRQAARMKREEERLMRALKDLYTP